MPPSESLSVAVRVDKPGFSLDVAFEAPPGVTILFGPSGSGKSTTLAAIAGLLRPTSGRVALGDVVWFDKEKSVDLAVEKRRVAYVFQSLALFPHMTATANVMYGMQGARTSDEQRAALLLERFGVGHLAARMPATFSGGEAQRVALARALGMSPRVILMDEPFNALDHAVRSELVRDVRNLVKELSVPVIFVTHHCGEARALGECAVLIERGQIVRTGRVSDIIPSEGAFDP
jgi:molybdate transport system ATP-binding protein